MPASLVPGRTAIGGERVTQVITGGPRMSEPDSQLNGVTLEPSRRAGAPSPAPGDAQKARPSG